MPLIFKSHSKDKVQPSRVQREMIKHSPLITVFGPMMASRLMRKLELLTQSVISIVINAMFMKHWGNKCSTMLGKGIIAACSLMVRLEVGNHTLW